MPEKREGKEREKAETPISGKKENTTGITKETIAEKTAETTKETTQETTKEAVVEEDKKSVPENEKTQGELRNNFVQHTLYEVIRDGCEIAEITKDLGALIGPCHAFTPWTALYAYHDSLKSCYGDMTDYVSFIELGLSADSDYADRIGELQRLTFLTNSDAHSPSTNKLAREFTQFNVPEITFA